jgi:hypothetical protein
LDRRHRRSVRTLSGRKRDPSVTSDPPVCIYALIRDGALQSANGGYKDHLMKRPEKKRAFGNSYLFLNLKFWKCGYCGNLIKDKHPFSITLINSHPEPFILCSANCLKIFIIKLEAQRG